MAKKKPTMKEVQEIIGQILYQIEATKRRVLNLEHVVADFISFNGKEDEFKEYLDKKMEEHEKARAREDAKNGAKGSVRDDKQQVVSASK